MAAAIETMAWREAGGMPWHKLGNAVGEATTSLEMERDSGLDWEVELQALVTFPGMQVVEDKRAVVRKTDKKTLGIVGLEYKPLQNREAFKWFDSFVESGHARYETAGSLDEGRRVWVMCKLGQSPLEIAPNDYVERYLLLAHGHNGAFAIRCGFTPVRVVCANTLAMAQSSQLSKLIRILHTRNLHRDLAVVKDTINVISGEFEATAEQYRRLVKRSINKADIENYVRQVFEIDSVGSDVVHTIVELNDKEGLGNWWGIYNSVTEFLSHHSASTLENRYNRLWFGDNKKRNQAALDLALQLSA